MKYNCVICGVEFDESGLTSDALCSTCSSIDWTRREIGELKKTYSVPAGRQRLDDCLIPVLEDARKHLETIRGSAITFDEASVLEAPDWWYIPNVWIGCSGHIIDKKDGHVNQLGSCHSLDHCFWAHNRGIKYDWCDLRVLRIHDLAATVEILMKMGNRAPINPIPNKVDDEGQFTKWWEPDQLVELLASPPVTFSNQVLWFTIRALHKAEECGYFEFEVTRGSWNDM